MTNLKKIKKQQQKATKKTTTTNKQNKTEFSDKFDMPTKVQNSKQKKKNIIIFKAFLL